MHEVLFDADWNQLWLLLFQCVSSDGSKSWVFYKRCPESCSKDQRNLYSTVFDSKSWTLQSLRFQACGTPCITPLSRMQIQVRAFYMLASNNPLFDMINRDAVLNNDPTLMLKLGKTSMPSDLCSSQAQLIFRVNINWSRAPSICFCSSTTRVC